jgi:putative copper export protein/methionine-rich copper-binding protein CopC
MTAARPASSRVSTLQATISMAATISMTGIQMIPPAVLLALAAVAPVLASPGLDLSAHPALLRASPGEGEALEAPPTEIRLTFSEPVNLVLARVELWGASGAVGLSPLKAHPDSANVVIAAIPGPLAAGQHTIRWGIVGRDGHPVEGEYAFTLLAAPADTLAPVPGIPPGVDPAGPVTEGGAPVPAEGRPGARLAVDSPIYVLVRWLNLGGIIGTLGAVAFQLLVLPLARRLSGPSGASAPPSLPRTVGLFSALLVLLSAAGRLLAQRAAVFGTDSVLALGQGTGNLLAGSWGAGWMIQVAAAATALVGFSVARSRPGIGWTLAALAIPLLSVSTALSGHAVSVEGLGPLPILAHSLHVVGAGGWIGSLFVLWLSAARSAGATGGDPHPWVHLVRAFSPIALAFAGLVAITGLFSAWMHLGGPGAVWGSDYGRVLLVKIALLVGVFAAGAFNALWVRPALARGEGPGRLRRTAGIELAAATMVLLVTSLLVATPPP